MLVDVSGAVPSAVGVGVGVAFNDVTNAIKSGSDSIVPARASVRPDFFGAFWNGEYSI